METSVFFIIHETVAYMSGSYKRWDNQNLTKIYDEAIELFRDRDWYGVSRNGEWGVYSLEEQKEIIPLGFIREKDISNADTMNGIRVGYKARNGEWEKLSDLTFR